MDVEASLEAVQDEITELKDQIELKDCTIHRLRTTPTKARITSGGQDTDMYEKEIRDLHLQLKLGERQRRQIAESSLLC